MLEIDLLSSDEIVGYVYLARSTCPPLVLSYAFGGCPTFMRTEWLEPGEYHLVAAPGFERQISCNGQNGHQEYILTATLLSDPSAAPENDDCALAQVIENGSWPFSTILSGTDGPTESPPECGDFGTSIGSDVWFEYTASCSGEISISLCEETDFDSRLEIWEGGCDGTLIACNDDGDSCGYASELVFTGECESRTSSGWADTPGPPARGCSRSGARTIRRPAVPPISTGTARSRVLTCH